MDFHSFFTKTDKKKYINTKNHTYFFYFFLFFLLNFINFVYAYIILYKSINQIPFRGNNCRKASILTKSDRFFFLPSFFSNLKQTKWMKIKYKFIHHTTIDEGEMFCERKKEKFKHDCEKRTQWKWFWKNSFISPLNARCSTIAISQMLLHMYLCCAIW